MLISKDNRRVRLEVDLTRYHGHLVPGVEGTALGGVKVGIWGSEDRFWAVRFDCCGETLDILVGSLTELQEKV